MPYLVEEPFSTLVIPNYDHCDVLLGRSVIMLGNFSLRRNGDFVLEL